MKEQSNCLFCGSEVKKDLPKMTMTELRQQFESWKHPEYETLAGEKQFKKDNEGNYYYSIVRMLWYFYVRCARVNGLISEEISYEK